MNNIWYIYCCWRYSFTKLYISLFIDLKFINIYIFITFRFSNSIFHFISYYDFEGFMESFHSFCYYRTFSIANYSSWIRSFVVSINYIKIL